MERFVHLLIKYLRKMKRKKKKTTWKEKHLTESEIIFETVY